MPRRAGSERGGGVKSGTGPIEYAESSAEARTFDMPHAVQGLAQLINVGKTRLFLGPPHTASFCQSYGFYCRLIGHGQVIIVRNNT